MIDTVRTWQKLRSSNATDTSFASKIPTVTAPTEATAGVQEEGTSGQVSSILQLMFFGAGNDDQTFDARVIGWNYINGLWIPTPLAQLSCTLSTMVGVTGQSVTDTDRFADTVTLATGYNSAAVEVVSPTGNIGAHVQMDLKGFQLFEVTFDMTGATSGNCLYRLL